MKKSLLSALLALCMTFALQPAAALADDPAAKIRDNGYDTLQEAVAAAVEGDTIALLKDITENIHIPNTFTPSFTLDLNGRTLSSGGANAICHNGSGTLTITDSTAEKNGKVTSQASGSETILVAGGSLVLESGTVEHAGVGWALHNFGGSVEITGGRVCSSASTTTTTIMNQFGTLHVSGGTITAKNGTAIFIAAYGHVTIGGTAEITSANTNQSFGTVFMPYFSNQGTDTALEITGGTIENTASSGIALNNTSTCTVEISGGVVNASGTNGIGVCANNPSNRQGTIAILSGTPIIKGRGMAMSTAPALRLDTQLRASINYDADALEDHYLTLFFMYDLKNTYYYRYKYFRFGPSTAVARIGEKFYTDLQDAFDYGASESTIQLLCDISVRERVFVDKGKNFTLDLNGKTISSGNANSIIENNWGTLTITDSSDDKNGAIVGGISNFQAILNRSTLVIVGGTVCSNGESVYAIRNPLSGTVNIAGGTVYASGNNAHAIYNEISLGTVNVSAGTVSASGTGSAAIYNARAGTVNVSGGIINSAQYFAIYTGSKDVTISVGWPILKGGIIAMNRAPIFNPANMTVMASGNYDGSSPVIYDAKDIAAYRYLEFVPIPVIDGNDQSSGIDFGGGNTPPVGITLYNDSSKTDTTIWLNGYGLSGNDLLVTQAVTSGDNYNAMLKLADKEAVFCVYEISLKSGKTSTGSPMHLTFVLADQYAGQTFTLVHKRADGSFEYFYTTADENGEVRFGPIYELSPFMLVRGRLLYTPTDEVVGIPKTGDASSSLPIALLALAMCGMGAMVYRKKRI